MEAGPGCSQNGYYSSPPKTGIIVAVLVLIFGGKGREKRGKHGEKSEKEKHEKELGLVVSQQTVIRNQAKTQRRNGYYYSDIISNIFLGKKAGKNKGNGRKSEKEKNGK